MEASISAIKFKISPCISFIFFDKLPSKCLWATIISFSVLEFIISITASAWDKSILPFINALLVNSPGSARTAPFFKHSSKIWFSTTMPPCEFISHIFSLV